MKCGNGESKNLTSAPTLVYNTEDVNISEENKYPKKGEQTMRWKTTNLHLQKGNKLAVYRDSALFFR